MSYLFRSAIVCGIIVSAAIVGERSARADILDIPASTNAFVLRSQADTAQGVATQIVTKRLNDSNTRLGYLRFDLGPLGGADVLSATLRLNLVSSSAASATETAKIWGLNDGAANAGGTVTETNWSNTDLTFNNQPIGAFANAAAALPITGKTTPTLASLVFDSTAAGIKDFALNNTEFQTFLTADTNDQLTLLVTTTLNANVNWSSLTNTGGFLVPTLRLEVTALCDPGDVNCDGEVDVENDFEAIRLNFQKSPRNRANGDLTGDSIVNFDDFIAWKGAFFAEGNSLEGIDLNFSTTPEPSSLLMLVAASLLLAAGRQRVR